MGKEKNAKALADFKWRYPQADMSKFVTKAIYDDKDYTVTANVLFKVGPDGVLQSVSGLDPKNWSHESRFGSPQTGPFSRQFFLEVGNESVMS